MILSAVPALAANLAGASSESPASSEQLNEPRAFDGHLVPPELGRLEREEREQQEWLKSPDAMQQRETSQTAYSDISAEESEQLLHEIFAEQLGELNDDPARFLSDAQLIRPLSPTVATVKSEGTTSLFDAGIPVRPRDDEGNPSKVDLSLEPTPGGYETANAISEISLPNSASGEIEVGEEGFTIAQAGAGINDHSQRFGDKNLFYPNVARDTDLIAAPTGAGLELFNLLRSKESPENLHFYLELPEGSELREDTPGGAEVVSEGEALLTLVAPTATDAQGTKVPMTMTVDASGITLHVEHRAGSYAYPILADPIVEDWANNGVNWYGGFSAAALTNGAWLWNTNNSNIVHDVCCWAARYIGLMINMRAAFYGPEQFGQWSYSTPNVNSYIEHAWITPFWRADYSCTAAQPHDYAGFLNLPGGTWNPIRQNEALNGGTSMDGHGQAFIIGMGSGPPGVWSACDRNLYAGGVALWLNDNQAPTWNSTPGIPGEWTDTTPLPISVAASDPGLGVSGFNLYTADSNGKALILMREAKNGCSGLFGSRCPNSWSTQINGYSTAGLPTGVNPLVVIGYDPPGHNSAGSPILLKVDHTAPVINWSGELLSQNPKKFHLNIEAVDGSSASLSTAQSGMKSVEVFLDGQLAQKYPEAANPSACSNVQQGINLGSCKFEFPLDLARSVSGKHTIKVVATDSLNHVTSRSLELNLPADVTPPEVTASGPLRTASGGWVANISSSVSIEAHDSETGVTEEAVYVDSTRVGAPATQECYLGGCGMSHSFSVPLSGYSQGEHTIRVIAKDNAGKVGETSWPVKVDSDRPTLSAPTTTPAVTDQWIPQTSTVEVNYEAMDEGAGIKEVELQEPVLGGGMTSSDIYMSGCDGSPSAPCAPLLEGSTTIETESLPQGSDVITFIAFDAMGHMSSERSITVDVDRDPPEVDVSGVLFSSEGEVAIGTTSTLSLSVTDKGGGVGQIEFLVDGRLEESLTAAEIAADGGVEACEEELCSLTFSYSPEIGPTTTTGSHEVSLVVTDRAGHAATTTNSVLIDSEPPDIHLTGTLWEASGQVLAEESGNLHVTAEDAPTLLSSGMDGISVAVDGGVVYSTDPCSEAPCPAEESADYIFDKSAWGDGPHRVEVTATDEAGNSRTRVIQVDTPLSSVAPPCPNADAVELPVGELVSASEARQSVESVVPEAFTPNVAPEMQAEEEAERKASEASLEPKLVPSKTPVIDPQGLQVQGSPIGGGVSDQAAGSFTVGQAICMAPLQTTSAETTPAIPNDTAALYANSAPATDTVIRPTVAGTIIIENVRGEEAPDEFSWEIDLRPGEELRSLENGGVAVVQPEGVNVDEVDTSEIPAQTGDMGDVESQFDQAQRELGMANNQIDGEVVAVISPPEAIGDNGQSASALLKIGPVNVVTAILPENTIANLEAMIIAANAPWEPETLCAQASRVDPALYTEGCSDPYDPNPTEPTPAPPGEEFKIADLRFPTEPSLEAARQLAMSEGEANVSEAQPASTWDRQWCYSDYRRAYACGFFERDAILAAGAETYLFNVPSDDTKANAFRHAFWTALMIGEEGISDSMAMNFALNHERGQESNKYRRVHYKSAMDVLNDFVGYRFEHFRSGHSHLAACEYFVEKIGTANFIGFDENPIRWANRVGFTAQNLVYRRKTEEGKIVRLVSQNCVNALAVAAYEGGVYY